MELPSFPHRFSYFVAGEKLAVEHFFQEKILPGGKPTTAAPVFHERRSILRTIRAGLGILLRILSLGLFASPLLIPVRLLFAFFDPSLTGGLIVGFVAWVCAFFAVLNLYFLVAFFAWVFRPTQPFQLTPSRLPASLLEQTRAERKLLNDARQGQAVYCNGKAFALGHSQDAKGLLLRETWDNTGLAAEFQVFARNFVVYSEGQPPLVVHIKEPLNLVFSSGTDPEVQGSNEVAQGATVEIFGEKVELLEDTNNIKLDGETFSLEHMHSKDGLQPFRQGNTQRAYLLSTDASTVLRIARS